MGGASRLTKEAAGNCESKYWKLGKAGLPNKITDAKVG